ncbi:response regulator transcription factor, partial [Rhizobium ruizarguesonis]
MTSITIGVVDDHPLFREGVTRSLSEMSGFNVIGEGASSDDAAVISSDNCPDIMLLDISMPGGGLRASTSL